MIVGNFGQSQSPGNEQRDFWGSAAADTPGSRNLIGIKDPVVDELIDKIITAHSREDLVTALPRARPRAAVGPLRDPALAQPGDPRRLLGQVRAPGSSGRRYGVDLFAWWVDPRAEAAEVEKARQEPGCGSQLSGQRCWPISSAGCC